MGVRWNINFLTRSNEDLKSSCIRSCRRDREHRLRWCRPCEGSRRQTCRGSSRSCRSMYVARWCQRCISEGCSASSILVLCSCLNIQLPPCRSIPNWSLPLRTMLCPKWGFFQPCCCNCHCQAPKTRTHPRRSSDMIHHPRQSSKSNRRHRCIRYCHIRTVLNWQQSHL